MSRKPSSQRVLLGSLVWLVGCIEIEEETQSRAAKVRESDVGTRTPQREPAFVAEAACPSKVSCSASDHNGDGRMDIVRRDPFGVFGPPGEVSIAMAHEWGYGPFERLADGCNEGDLCLVGDLDGLRGAELLRIEPKQGRVIAYRLHEGGKTEPLAESVQEGFCQGDQPRCSIIPGAEDQRGPQLAWLDSKGLLWTLDLGNEQTKPRVRDTACAPGMQCRFAEVDAKPGPELLVWDPKESKGIFVEPSGEGQGQWIGVDCASRTCEFADVDGDGLVDVLQRSKEFGPLWWTSGTQWEFPFEAEEGATCNAKERCFWADGNGDGFDDLFRIDPLGTLSFHPTLDVRGRLEFATMELSLLATRQTRADYAQIEAAQRSLVTAFAPNRVEPGYEAMEAPLDPAIYDARRRELETRIEWLVDAVLADVPTESDTSSDADVRRIRELTMDVVAARTVVSAAPLGVSRRGESCGNVVLHDRTILDGVEHRAPSYLFRFAEALALGEHDARVEELVGVMTAITAGLRCLNNDELVMLDAAFSDAVLQTADELRERGRPMAAKWLMDSAMPLVLLTFDAAKYTAVPPSYRLLSARVGSSIEPGAIPEAGFDFDDAAEDPSCDTFLCQTYGNRRRSDAGARGLMLDELGVWLPDPMSSGRLTRVDIDPHDLLTNMLDLRVFGEGDCSLLEVSTRAFTCPSRATCNSDRLAEDPLGGVMMPAGLEAYVPQPGDLGSSFTHLGTSRGPGLSTRNGCDGEGSGSGAAGGAIMGGCMGPPLGSRRGRFSADPELDTLMRCALEASAAPIDTDLHLGSGCLASQDAPEEPEEPEEPAEPEAPEGEGGEGGDAPPSIAEMFRQYPDMRRQVVDVLRNGGTIRFGGFEYSRDQLVAGLRDAFPGARNMTEENIIGLLSGDVADAVERARPGSISGGALGETGGPSSNPNVTINIGAHAGMADPIGELARTLVHEAVHVFMMEAEHRGWIRSFGGAVDRDHRITGRLGLGTLCAAASDCSSGCGMEDEFIQRFQECANPVEPIDASDIQCRVARDYCEDRMLGRMGAPLASGCVPSLSLASEPECLVVHCGSDAGTIASFCCGAESSGWSGAIPVFEVDVGPGPRPPRPTLEVFFEGWPSDLPFE